MFLLIHELVGDFDLQKQTCRIDLVRRARFLMLARLQQIRAIQWTIKRHFTLLAAALRTDAPMHRRAKALFLSDFTNRATQIGLLEALLHLALNIPLSTGRNDSTFQISDFRLQIEDCIFERNALGMVLQSAI